MLVGRVNTRFFSFSTRALRTQRDAYRQMNWRASVTTRTVRATPLSVVVAPAQRLDWYPTPSVLRPGGEKR